MAKKKKSRFRVPETLQLQLAPMLDVLYILLLYFIITWHEVVTEAHLAINLPSVDITAPKPEKPPQFIEIYVMADRYMWMGLTDMRIDQLQSHLISAASFDTEATVLIKVHQEAQEGRLVKLLDTCAYAGLTHLNVMTLKKEFGP